MTEYSVQVEKNTRKCGSVEIYEPSATSAGKLTTAGEWLGQPFAKWMAMAHKNALTCVGLETSL